jgi:hypothetical protein
MAAVTASPTTDEAVPGPPSWSECGRSERVLWRWVGRGSLSSMKIEWLPVSPTFRP